MTFLRPFFFVSSALKFYEKRLKAESGKLMLMFASFLHRFRRWRVRKKYDCEANEVS